MNLLARLRALITTSADQTSHRPITAMALVLALAPACGEPGEPGTTDSTSGQTATDDPSTGETSTNPTTGTTGNDNSTTDATTDTTTASTDPTTDPTTDATTGEPGANCADWCQQASACAQLSVEQCTAECESADHAMRTCLLACDQTQCDDLLMCTTVCAQPGDPNATPYSHCEEDASTCAPGVYLCMHSSHDGLDFSVCTPFCDDDDQCPVPATGTATPQCDTAGEPSLCTLDCSQGQQCPDDMVCDLEGSGMCMWPIE
jgi:hypothetical protein